MNTKNKDGVGDEVVADAVTSSLLEIGCEEISKFYEPGVSNRALENTSFNELTSILDNFSSPVGEMFIDTAIQHSPLDSRKDICDFLGIRESTL